MVTHLRCETRAYLLKSAADEKKISPFSVPRVSHGGRKSFCSSQFQRWFAKCPRLFEILEEWTSNCRQFAALKGWTHSAKHVEKVQENSSSIGHVSTLEIDSQANVYQRRLRLLPFYCREWRGNYTWQDCDKLLCTCQSVWLSQCTFEWTMI